MKAQKIRYEYLIVLLLATLLGKGCKCKKDPEPMKKDFSAFKIGNYYNNNFVECDTCINPVFELINPGFNDSMVWFIDDRKVWVNTDPEEWEFIGPNFTILPNRKYTVKAIAYSKDWYYDSKGFRQFRYLTQTTEKSFVLDIGYKHFYGEYKGVYNYAPKDSVVINMAQVDTIGAKDIRCEVTEPRFMGGSNRMVQFLDDSTSYDPQIRCYYPIFNGIGYAFYFSGNLGMSVEDGSTNNGVGVVSRNGDIRITCTVSNRKKLNSREYEVVFTGRRIKKYQYDPSIY